MGKTDKNKIIVEIIVNSKGITQVKTAIKGIGTAAKTSKASVRTLGGAINGLKASLGPMLIIFQALYMAKELLSNMIGITMKYSKAQSTLASVLKTTKDNIEELNVMAQEYGRTTQFTAEEVTHLEIAFSRLGYSKGKIIGLIKPTIDLASALGVELQDAAVLVGNTMNAFQLKTEDSQHAMEVLGLATTKTSLDFEKLSVALPYVGAIAHQMNISLEETVAHLGQLTDFGLAASRAGTGLRKVYTDLAKKGMTLNEAFLKINGSTNRVAAAVELFGVRAASTALILSATKDKTRELTEEYIKAKDVLDQMAKTKLDNLSGDVTKLSSAWEGFVLRIEDGNGAWAKFSRNMTQGITNILNTMATDDILDELGIKGRKAFSDFTQNQLDIVESYNQHILDAAKATADSNLETIKEAKKEEDVIYLEQATWRASLSMEESNALTNIHNQFIETLNDEILLIEAKNKEREEGLKLLSEEEQAFIKAQEAQAKASENETDFQKAQRKKKEEADKEAEKALQKAIKMEEKRLKDHEKHLIKIAKLDRKYLLQFNKAERDYYAEKVDRYNLTKINEYYAGIAKNIETTNNEEIDAIRDRYNEEEMTAEKEIELEKELAAQHKKYSIIIQKVRHDRADEIQQFEEDLHDRIVELDESILTLKTNHNLKMLSDNDEFYDDLKKFEEDLYLYKLDLINESSKSEEEKQKERENLAKEHSDKMKGYENLDENNSWEAYYIKKEKSIKAYYKNQEEILKNAEMSEEERTKMYIELEKQKQEELDALATEGAEHRKKLDDEWLETFLDIMNKISDGIGLVADAMSQHYDNQLYEAENAAAEQADLQETTNTDALDALEALHDADLISDAEYEHEKKNLLAQGLTDKSKMEHDAAVIQAGIAKKAFDIAKITDIIQIAINTAMGISSALATFPPNVPLAAFIGATGIASSAIIASKKFHAPYIPDAVQYGEGGYISGDLHSNSSGGVSATLEGGEMVMSRGAVSKYAPELNQMLADGNGEASSSESSINNIDYDKLSDAINNKKIYVLSNDITEKQNDDIVLSNRNSF